MRKIIKIPTILGLLVAIVGLGLGIWAAGNKIGRNVQASAEETPDDVRITNVTDSSVTVSWITQIAISGYVQYGETNPELVVGDERDQQAGNVGNYLTHFVTVAGLKPQTKYVFKIGSGKNLYGSNDGNYEITTASTIATTANANVAYGQVFGPAGDPGEGAIVYLEGADLNPQSALVRQSGSWVLPLATARNKNLSGIAQLNDDTVLSVIVQGGTMGKSTVQVTPAKYSPVADITLGQDRDLTSSITPTTEPAASESGTPVTEMGSSKFAAAQDEIIVLSPRIGESVDNSDLKVVGKAPAGTKMEIEIHSDEVITGKATADSNGDFNYVIPDNLTPREHTITIRATIDGVVKTITRSFVVYAAESGLPEFSATPSATLAPTQAFSTTPSPTLKITNTPTPKPTVTPAPTGAIVAPTETIAPVDELPQTGNGEITWTLMIIGGIMTALGGWWYRRAA